MSRPSRRERFRPAELVGLSAVAAVFVGVVVLLATRQLELTLIFAGVAFILALLGFAMLALAESPPKDPADGPVLLPKPKDHPRD